MAPLNVLICGGGCAGPSLAYWLVRSGHHVTIVERYPVLRASGAQIDIRAQGIELVKRMGLLPAIRKKLVDEPGMSLVDVKGNALATLRANKSGKGAQALTSEYEIMRGDLVRVLYDATKDDVKYIFGKSVEHFEQDDKCVTVRFSDGQTGKFDVLVGADGQGSRIRQAILPPDAPDPYRRFGLYFSYWIVPRTEADSNFASMYNIPGSRAVMSRSHNQTETQAAFVAWNDSKEWRSIPKAPIESQKEFWIQKFQGEGWKTARFIEGLKATDSFYCHEILQVRTDTWSKGRVVLLADAGYTPSPITGMGTTSAFVGAYVLAGELSRNSDDLPQAFANYDIVLRPFVNEIQKIQPWIVRIAYPETKLGIFLFRLIVGILCFLRIPDLLFRFSRAERGGWQIPDYPELNVAR